MTGLKWTRLLSAVFFITAFLIGLHHFLICGKWFDLEDMLHHEFLWGIALSIGLGIEIGRWLSWS